jgi:serralysin
VSEGGPRSNIPETDTTVLGVVAYKSAGISHVDGILGGVKWANGRFTYSFPTDSAFYGTSYGLGESSAGFGVLNPAQQNAVRSVFDVYASVAKLDFVEISETATQHADFRFAMSDKPQTAWAYLPDTSAEAGDVWFNTVSGSYTQPWRGEYAYLTVLHEIGHTLGLEHPHESGMPVERDSMEYTGMSYRSYVGASVTSGYVNETWGFAQSLMMDDIAAVQHMYGANYAANSGNTVYTWSPDTGEMFVNGIGQGAAGENRVFLTVWDGGGNDTYDFSNYATDLRVDLRPGQWTTTSEIQRAKLSADGSKLAVGNIANALLHNGNTRSLIEKVVGGSGHDALTGNQANNALNGGAGNDHLIGHTGKDALVGGSDDDLLDGGSGNDVLTGGRGEDIFVFASKLGAASTDRRINFDTIKDFSVPDDSIYLDNAIFRKVGMGTTSSPGQLNKNFFALGSKAADKNDYIIYNKKTGVLSYDADGSSSKAKMVEFAHLKKGLALTHLDFFVI